MSFLTYAQGFGSIALFAAFVVAAMGLASGVFSGDFFDDGLAGLAVAAVLLGLMFGLGWGAISLWPGGAS